MSINRIVKLNHPGVLHDFVWPGDLSPFTRFNLIYGWNGTGKTSISGLFQHLERKTAPSYETTLSIDGQNLRGQDFGGTEHEIRVFNRGFIDRNVFHAEGIDLPLILVLGEESAESQRELAQLRTEDESQKTAARDAKERVQSANNDLDGHCKTRAREIKDLLTSEGENRYRFYDKGDYERTALRLSGEEDVSRFTLSETQLERLRAIHTASPGSVIEALDFTLPDVAEYGTLVNALLAKSATSQTIEALRSQPEVADWAQRGLELHDEMGSDECLFCDQRLPPGRLLALRTHFDQALLQLQSEIRAMMLDMGAAQATAERLGTYDSARLHDALADEWEDAARGFERDRATTVSALESLTAALNSKMTKLFESLQPISLAQTVTNNSIANMNSLIERHNELSNNREDEQKAAREKLELHYVAGSGLDFARLQRRINDAEQNLEEKERELTRITLRIEKLESTLIEHRRPASELNNELSAYLGHNELTFEVSDTGYAVSRAGSPAVGLSDGEKSSIALLYFLKTLEHKDFAAERGVVVLDDPVSSLDAQALYMAMGFVKNNLRSVSQLFILTHNWGCFRLVKDWFDGVNRGAARAYQDEPCSFYMLDCRLVGGRRRATLKRLDPLLERFKTEYHYLFARVYEVANSDSDAGLTDYFAMPNLARRLLEAFFAFASPGAEGDFASTLGNCDFDSAKKTAIQRFLNLESHGDGIGESRRDLSQLAKTPEVMKDILALMRSENETHFERMARVMRRQQSQR